MSRDARRGGWRVVRLVRQELRTDRSGTLALAVLVLVSTILATGAPIAFTKAADAALPEMMAAAPAVQRDLGFTLEGPLNGPADDPLAAVIAAGEHIRDDLPPSLSRLVSTSVVAADTVDMAAPELDNGDGFTANLRLRAQPGVEDALRFVRGRAPMAAEGDILSQDPLPTVEVAVSSETARWLGRDIGDAFTLQAERSERPMSVRIVGVFEPIDPGADVWADRALVAPRVVIEGDSDRIDVHGTALMAVADVAPVAILSGGAFRYAWRYLLDWNAADDATRAAIATDLANLRVRYPFRSGAGDGDVPSISTGLSAIVERYLLERSAAQAAATLALIGPAAAAVGALAMIGATIARRRQGTMQLMRSRGASDRAVLAVRALVAAVIVVPPAIVGALAVLVLAGPTWAAPVIGIAALVAGLAIVLTLVATAQALGEAGGHLRQVRPSVWWGGPRSLVRDGLLIVIAVAGVSWIGSRGATDASDGAAVGAGGPPDIDPLLLLVPVLVAMAGAVLAWRAYVPLVRAGARLAAAHRGFVPVHALRGPSRGAGALHAPLIVLVVTIAIGVFSAIVVVSLQRQQELVAWQTVGAEYRVESVTRQRLPLDMSTVEGVEAAADVVLREGFLAGGSVRALSVMGAALDVDAYRRVVEGTPADGVVPAALATTRWDASSGVSAESAVPAILVGEAARRPALRVGDPFELSSFGRVSHFVVAGILPSFPGASSPKGTVIVPLGAVKAADPERNVLPDQAFVRASPSIAHELEEATVGSFGAPNVSILARADVRAALEADPLVRDTAIGFGLALLVALLFAALVVAVAVVRDVDARLAEMALLRALGSRPRQLLGVIVLEQGTVVLTAVVSGLVLGCLMGVLAVPSLGLDRFVRPGDIIDATIDWPSVSTVAVVEALLALAVMFAAAVVARRRRPVPAMMRDA